MLLTNEQRTEYLDEIDEILEHFARVKTANTLDEIIEIYEEVKAIVDASLESMDAIKLKEDAEDLIEEDE